MKNTIIKSLALAAVAASFASCDDNAWNNKLDGYEEPGLKDVQSISYTLTDADYKAIASNKTNVALAGEEYATALKAVGTTNAFSEEITAAQYAPAFLSSSSFPYFALSDGSSIKLTYNVAVGMSEEAKQLNAADEYIVTDGDYQFYVWDSEDNYVDAFAPSKKPSTYINKILKDNYDDALAGDVVIVTYAESQQEPIFGGIGETPEEPGFEMSSVIGGISLGDDVTINGVVTGICTRGLIITDKTGSVLLYQSGFDYAAYAIGDQLVVNATVSSYNTGLQLDGTSAEIEKVGEQAYAYPAPKAYDGALLDQAVTRTDNALAEYCSITGTASVGNYVNFIVEGAETAQGSAYYVTDDIKAMLVDGNQYTISGYFVAVSSSRYFNMLITSVEPATAVAKAPVVAVPTSTVVAAYQTDGSKWSEVTNAVVLQPSDYTAMGQSYGNLSNNLPDEILPKYLAVKFPYASADDVKYVLYKYYSGGATSYVCDEYVFDGSAWTKDNGTVQETAQFVRNSGVWNYDPSVTLTLPSVKGNELSQTYYQACVDWVYVNVDQKIYGSTDIKCGLYYITSYGNNEYYAGTSAYQNDVDLRASAARTQFPDAYANMTDDEVVETMKWRFAYEVMPGALHMLHADAVPVPGIQVIYTINFVTYNGANSNETIRYEVTAPGEFTFLDCTWWEGGTPAE